MTEFEDCQRGSFCSLCLSGQGGVKASLQWAPVVTAGPALPAPFTGRPLPTKVPVILTVEVDMGVYIGPAPAPHPPQNQIRPSAVWHD